MHYYTVIQTAICTYIVVLAICNIYSLDSLPRKIFTTLFSIPLVIIGICLILWSSSMDECARDFVLFAIATIMVNWTFIVIDQINDKFN